MSVSLKKGQKVNLSKDNSNLTKVTIGLGWDEVKQSKLPKWLGGKKKEEFDVDAIAFLLDKDGKIADTDDRVFYNHLRHESKCVEHKGDNLTGKGEGDSEQILVNLSKLPEKYDKIVFLASIYKATEREQHFGMIKNAYIRLVDSNTNKELYIYNLSENYQGMTSMVFGELYRRNGEWKFNAIGQPMEVWSIDQLSEKYGFNKKTKNK